MAAGSGTGAWPPRGLLIVLFLFAVPSGAAMGVGALLSEGGWRAWEQVPSEAHLLVVARRSEAAAVQERLREIAGVRIRSVRSAGEVLAEVGLPSVGPELLNVFDIGVPESEGGAAVLAHLGASHADILDVIDLNAGERSEQTPRRASRILAVGLLLLLLACFAIVGAVSIAVEVAARWSPEEVGTRLLLGAEPESVAAGLATTSAMTAAIGVLAGLLLAASAGAAVLAPVLVGVEPSWWGLWLLAGVVSLLLLIVGRAAARQVVSDALRTVLMGALLIAAPLPGLCDRAAASESPVEWLRAAGVPAGPVQQAALVRALSRDLAVCARSRQATRKALLVTEVQAHRALRLGRDGLFRLARLKQAEELRFLRTEEGRCADLVRQRREAREALRAGRSLEPPIRPRGRPVPGAVAVAYGEGGQVLGTAEFRNAVGLRADRDDVVRAVASGEVVYASAVPGVGLVLVLDHGRRTYSVYARIEGLGVRVGEEVALGQAVARVQGPLLHFSVRARGRAVDPLRWIEDAPPG